MKVEESAGHLESAKHVLRYVQGSLDWGIRFTESDDDLANLAGLGSFYSYTGAHKLLIR